VKDRRWKST